MNARPDFPSYLAEMKWRGFFEQCTDEAALAALMAAGPITGYAGFDPTAESLHIGKLSLDGGELHVDGRIDSLLYEDTDRPSGGLLSRLFGG